MHGGTDRPRMSFVSPYSHLIALIFAHICVEEYDTLKSNENRKDKTTCRIWYEGKIVTGHERQPFQYIGNMC